MSIPILHKALERMGRNTGHKVFGLLVIFYPLPNRAFPLLGYADHLSFWAVWYAQIQGDVLLPLGGTFAAWVSTGSGHRNQAAAQQSFTADQFCQLRTGLPVVLTKIASMAHENPFD